MPGIRLAVCGSPVSKSLSRTCPSRNPVQNDHSGAISDALWKEIRPVIDNDKRIKGNQPADPRITLSGLLYAMQHGCSLRQIPAKYGKKTALHQYWQRWWYQGLFQLLEICPKWPELQSVSGSLANMEKYRVAFPGEVTLNFMRLWRERNERDSLQTCKHCFTWGGRPDVYDLPICRFQYSDGQNAVESCWKMTFCERLRVLFREGVLSVLWCNTSADTFINKTSAGGNRTKKICQIVSAKSILTGYPGYVVYKFKAHRLEYGICLWWAYPLFMIPALAIELKYKLYRFLNKIGIMHTEYGQAMIIRDINFRRFYEKLRKSKNVLSVPVRAVQTDIQLNHGEPGTAIRAGRSNPDRMDADRKLTKAYRRNLFQRIVNKRI